MEGITTKGIAGVVVGTFILIFIPLAVDFAGLIAHIVFVTPLEMVSEAMVGTAEGAGSLFDLYSASPWIPMMLVAPVFVYFLHNVMAGITAPRLELERVEKTTPVERVKTAYVEGEYDSDIEFEEDLEEAWIEQEGWDGD